MTVKKEDGNKLYESLLEVVERAYHKPFSTASDFAKSSRKQQLIGIACEEGFITLKSPEGDGWSNEWRPTVKGLLFLGSDIQI